MSSVARTQAGTAAPPGQPACITPEAVRAYLADLTARGRSADTVRAYAAWLRAFYDFLPPEKTVTRETLRAWCSSLLERGYAPGTINTHLSAANGLLGYLGRRELQLMGHLDAAPEVQPELTRAEYLRLLQTARALGRERTYLLVKVFALTGLRVGELPGLRAEAVETGQAGGPALPAGLRQELADYLRRHDIREGPVFVTRNDRVLRRTQVTAEIQALGPMARVEERKCNPRCLRKLYLAARAEVETRVRLLAEAYYARMLDAEQRTAGWESPRPPHQTTRAPIRKENSK